MATSWWIPSSIRRSVSLPVIVVRASVVAISATGSTPRTRLRRRASASRRSSNSAAPLTYGAPMYVKIGDEKFLDASPEERKLLTVQKDLWEIFKAHKLDGGEVAMVLQRVLAA